MMMMGIHFMGEVPFKEVYIHALVQDEEGKKMSKSKGNVSDPLEIIDAYGTDAFRFTLAAFAAQGRDIKMSEKRVEGYRHFVNKLWNATRFALMHLPEQDDQAGSEPIDERELSLPDRWILTRLDETMGNVSQALDGYHFNEAASTLYRFVWHEFCDWYLEAIKPRLYDEAGGRKQAATKRVLGRVLRDILVLLHPFTPFITEELWHRLPETTGSIMKAAFPSDDPSYIRLAGDTTAEAEMDLVIGVITGIRNVRGEMNISPAKSLTVVVQSQDGTTLNTIEQHGGLIANMAKLDALTVESPGMRPKIAATSIFDHATIFVMLEGIVDFSLESSRLEKEIGKIGKDLGGVSRKLSNEDFLAKAPEAVVEKVRGQHQAFIEKQEKLQANLDRIRSIEG
jgi:valyl-tRNA synthetase